METTLEPLSSFIRLNGAKSLVTSLEKIRASKGLINSVKRQAQELEEEVSKEHSLGISI